MSSKPKKAKEGDQGVISKAVHAAEEAVEKRVDLERLKERASHAVEDGIDDAKRIVKRGKYAAEDLVEDTAHRIKQEPWQAVGVTFSIGLGLGVVIGLLLGRESRKHD